MISLFDPIWKTQKPEKKDEAIAAVRQITDPKKLQEIALHAHFPEVRMAAIERISDPLTLEKIILDPETPYEIRRETVKDIDDPQILTAIAMQRPAYPADGDAIARITDQALLKQIALAEQGSEQEKAVYRITDQQILAEIALRAKKGSVRNTAIHCISDPDFLLDIMEADEEDFIRTEAHTRIKDITVPEGKLVLTDPQHERYLALIINETDRKVRIELPFFEKDDLERIYRNAARWDLKAAALSYLVLQEDYAPENLREAWKNAEAESKNIHNTFANPWQDARQSVEDRLEMEEINNPGLLLEFVNDTEVGSLYAADCIKALFEEQFDPYEEIKALRNEACAVFIRNIPAYAKQEGGSVKDYLIRLSGAVPPENCDRYGLTAFVEEYRAEKTE